MVYKVLNMDLFLHKCIDSLQEAFINPTELCGVIFMMDGFFLGFKSQHPFTAMIKLGRDRTFFNITPIVFIWKQKVLYI